MVPYAFAGNGGTSTTGKISNVNISEKDFAGLVRFAQQNEVRLAVIGPEQPLVDGIVEAFKTGTCLPAVAFDVIGSQKPVWVSKMARARVRV